MLADVHHYGIPKNKMTAVPMGVDTEISHSSNIQPIDDIRLKDKRVIVYLGTLDRARSIEVLFEMLVILKAKIPNLLLILVGDTEDSDHAAWLKLEAVRLGVIDSVLWTGWLPMEEGWRYVCAAELGLSPFPRSFLLDSASPTKAVEYMAIGLPVVVNDNPDQALIIQESQAGLCVKFGAASFAEAVITLLNDPQLRNEMAIKGKQYVASHRGYDSLSQLVASTYKHILR